MDSNLHDNDLLRSYLLGELSEPEADRLEKRLLADDELFQLSEAVEADLLAAYARGDLTPTEGKRVFHKLAASAGGQARLALARSLNTIASEPQQAPARVVSMRRRDAPASHPGTYWAALAAAALIAVAGASWFALQPTRQSVSPPPIVKNNPAPVNGTQPGQQKPPASLTTASVAEGPQPAPSPTHHDEHTSPKPPEPLKYVITLTLTSPLRGAEGAAAIEEFRIPPGTSFVKIQLEFEDLEHQKSFHAVVRREDHTVVWEKSGIAPRRMKGVRRLVLDDLPAARLPSGRYEAEVTTETEELTQPFKVIQEMQ